MTAGLEHNEKNYIITDVIVRFLWSEWEHFDASSLFSFASFSFAIMSVVYFAYNIYLLY